MNRDYSLQSLKDAKREWDFAIIGGGATGVGISLDAAARGYSVCLLEQSDFGSGTSSRSTKLIHGGVRYLQQGNLYLVKEALKERESLRRNAPHLVHPLGFIIPNYSWWEAPYYGIGLKLYDRLAKNNSFGSSHHLSKSEVLEKFPTLESKNLRGGVLYFDGQFDDARLLIDLAHTATQVGATLINYCPVIHILHSSDGRAEGVIFRDQETGEEHRIKSKGVINAAGPFADFVRQLDQPTSSSIISPSQGSHVVLDQSFLPGNSALIIPRTADGRVMFAIPWLNHTLLGTTDTPISKIVSNPSPKEEEIDFLLTTARKYLTRKPTRENILATFAGIRPLVTNASKSKTKSLARDHSITVSQSNLLTITGGKWTTYRHMAEQAVNQAANLANLPARPCPTTDLKIQESTPDFTQYPPDYARPLHPGLPYTLAHFAHGLSHEMAQTPEDLLARRTRISQLNSGLASTLKVTLLHHFASLLRST